MSILEEKVRASLTPLIIGNPCTLSEDDQTTIATWATMKAMVGETLYPGAAITPRLDRHHLRLSGTPPVGWYIRVVPSSCEMWRVAHHHYSAGIAVSGEPHGESATHSDARNVQWTMFGLHRLLVLAFSSTVDPSIFSPDLRAMNEKKVPRIWPKDQQTIVWNPNLTVNDSVFEYIALSQRRFIAAGMKSPSKG